MGQKGNLIVFEGIDGSGKSTQIQMLSERLKMEQVPCYTTMEPTDGLIGSLIRNILTGKVKMDNKVIAALFAADRLDHLLNEVDGIKAMTENGTTVICDRYYFSSYAYHAVDMPMEWVISTNEQSAEILRPAVTVFIDIDADTAMERITKNRARTELFEKHSRLAAVRENYMKAFAILKEKENIVIVDGTKTPEEIAGQVYEAVKPYVLKQ